MRTTNTNTTTTRGQDSDTLSSRGGVDLGIGELQELQNNNQDYITDNNGDILMIQVIQRTQRL